MYELDTDFSGLNNLPQAELNPDWLKGGVIALNKSISPDFSAADGTAKILEQTITPTTSGMNVSLKLSKTAGLLAWLSDRGVMIGGLLDLQPALKHVFTLPFAPSSTARTLRVNLEVVNP